VNGSAWNQRAGTNLTAPPALLRERAGKLFPSMISRSSASMPSCTAPLSDMNARESLSGFITDNAAGAGEINGLVRRHRFFENPLGRLQRTAFVHSRRVSSSNTLSFACRSHRRDLWRKRALPCSILRRHPARSRSMAALTARSMICGRSNLKQTDKRRVQLRFLSRSVRVLTGHCHCLLGVIQHVPQAYVAFMTRHTGPRPRPGPDRGNTDLENLACSGRPSGPGVLKALFQGRRT
jgi:hypothetical protein